MTAAEAVRKLSNTPCRKATRYVVKLADGDQFTVLVLNGTVPREKVGSMIGETERVSSIIRDSVGL